MWAEFVVGSLPCSKGFSPGHPVFLPPQKSTLQMSLDLETVDENKKSHLVECPLLNSDH